ncbi:uncharacterized protein [Parasteatoda tepidariorum]|uniref:uncharacterized protein n=1 Tax=Parasteatoda tepidariorum TaxID=114398 RepID=UPI00077FC818|nr:uncharacterized protein LOC107442856 [Parasteatoda tepidariorum]
MKKKETECFVSFLLAWFLWSAANAAFVSNIKTSDGLEIGSHHNMMQNSTKNVTNESRAFDDSSRKQNSDNIFRNQIFDKFETKLSKERISTETVSIRVQNLVKTTIEPYHDLINNKEQVLNQDGMKLNLKKINDDEKTSSQRKEDKNESLKRLNFQKPDGDIERTDAKEDDKKHLLDAQETDQADFEKDLYETVFREVGSEKNAKSKLFSEEIELMNSSSEEDSDEIWDELLQNIDLNRDNVSMYSDIHIEPPILVDDASYDDAKEDVSIRNILKRESLLSWSIDSKSNDYDSTAPTASTNKRPIESQDQPLSRDPTERPPQPSEPSSSPKSPEVLPKTMQSNTVHSHMLNRLGKRRLPNAQRPSKERPRLAPPSSEDQASSEAQSSEQSMSEEVSMPTSSTICKPPSHLIHSDIQCTETNSETVCEQQCVHGHSTNEGIKRTHRCNKAEHIWRPSRLVSDCKPYVDCTITLKSGGHKRCYGNYKNQGPWCYLSCDSYEGKKRVKSAWYQCNINGSWDPPLPRCAIPGTRARLVKRPRIAHTDDGNRHNRKPPHGRLRKKRYVAEKESENEKNSESEEKSNDEAQKENEDIFI